MDNKNKILEITVVKSKEGIFISSGSREDWSRRHIDFRGYLINGERPKPTHNTDWYEVDVIPKTVERVKEGGKRTLHYKLKEGFTPNEITPETVPTNYFYDDDKSSFYNYYDAVTEQAPDTKENIDFKLCVVDLYKEFKPIQLDFPITHDLVNSIITPREFWSEIPCRIEIEESYKIIRKYIKNNIDERYAKITSDYDFCFTVQKKIPLVYPEKKKTKVYKSLRDKKGKEEIFPVYNKSVEIFNMAPKPYQSYNLAPTFEGENSRDLQKKIDKYCEDLIFKINEPLKECHCCKGYGVILDNEEKS